jgi:hypothetical protein
MLVMKKTLAFLIPILLIGGLIAAYNFENTIFKSSRKIISKYDMEAMVRVNNTTYSRSYNEVITDDRTIDKEIAVIKIKIEGESKLEDNSPWASTIAEPGTKVYSLKGLDEKEVVVLKINGEWEIFRLMNGLSQNHPIFTEDMLNAEKIVVRSVGEGKDEIKEIIAKETINKIALIIKNAEKLLDSPSYYQVKRYEYHFVVRDSNGVGQIGFRYFFTMQDINLDGFISTRGDDSYKVSAEFNKLITGPFGSIPSSYDEKLGGKQQLNEVTLTSSKQFFRKLIKEGPSTKTDVILLNQGENIWQNGNQIKDNLKGKYKLQLTMKDTTIQKKVMEKALIDITKVPGAVDLIFTEGSTKDTLVIYICFDSKPEYFIGEGDDSFVIEIKE